MKHLILFILIAGLSIGAAAQTIRIKPPKPGGLGKLFPAKIKVLKGDGITDDTDALNAWGRGEPVRYQGKLLGNTLQNGWFLISWDVDFNRPNSVVRLNTFVVKYPFKYKFKMVDFHWKNVRHYRNLAVHENRFSGSVYKRPYIHID